MRSARSRLLITASGSVGLVFLALNNPAETSWLPPCIFLKLTGFECPGCGSTRCLHEVLRGNLSTAMNLNVLSIIAMPWLLWRFGKWLVGRSPTTSQRDYRFIIGIGVCVVVFGVLRNIDYAPFTYLSAAK